MIIVRRINGSCLTYTQDNFFLMTLRYSCFVYWLSANIYNDWCVDEVMWKFWSGRGSLGGPSAGTALLDSCIKINRLFFVTFGWVKVQTFDLSVRYLAYINKILNSLTHSFIKIHISATAHPISTKFGTLIVRPK